MNAHPASVRNEAFDEARMSDFLGGEATEAAPYKLATAVASAIEAQL